MFHSHKEVKKGQEKRRLLILGASGRDYHNFNVLFRKDKTRSEVVGFTHSRQIPEIQSHRYPAVLAGELYPSGLPILDEDDLELIIHDEKIDDCILSYSDLSFSDVMNLAARCQVAGADFTMLSPEHTMLTAKVPVIAVTAVRTGCGKSQVSHYVSDVLRHAGLRCVLVRHPMPYGDLKSQTCQRFASYEDLDKYNVTIEEREEYEQHINRDSVVYAGVDYCEILEKAEEEADVIIWDGGNNDTSFYKPDLWIVVADPHRPGHEKRFYPGDVNFRRADIIIINKANTAKQKDINTIRRNAAECNPKATVIITDSELRVADEALVHGKKVVCVDDGPTITHGGATVGAAVYAAQQYGAAKVLDPRPYFVGALKEVLHKYPHIGDDIPAIGYNKAEIHDLRETINSVPADTVMIGTPIDLRRLIKIDKPATRVSYSVQDHGSGPTLRQQVEAFLQAKGLGRVGKGAGAEEPAGAEGATMRGKGKGAGAGEPAGVEEDPMQGKAGPGVEGAEVADK